MNLLTFALALCLVAQATANPMPATSRRDDQPPKLSETLTVAKSPFEPVTLANQRPDARNDGRQPAGTTVALELDEERKLTTRSVDYEEQQKSSSTKGLDESTGLQDSHAAGSTQSLATEKPDDEPASPVEATTTPEPATEADTKANESDEVTTTTTSTTQAPADVLKNEAQPSGAPVPAAPTTQEQATTTTATTTTTEATTTTTTPEPKEPETTTTPVPTTERVEEVTTTTSTTTPAPSTTSTTPEPTTTEAATTTTTTSQPETEPPTTHTELQREQSPTTTTTTSTSTTTTTPTPESTTPIRVVEHQPSTSPAPVENTSTLAEQDRDRSVVGAEDKAACDHLPAYNADEVQKVFREETTFRNGTIKGKFTYINFDQRYRLVHYTRLPYGPVKIDKVEELGRPKQEGSSNNATSTPTLNEVPNAVLQLRNLLPNSLFGFPFLGPNNGHLQPREGDDERSGMYFYSTDSLATPNLLTPRVPVSLLPGQRVKLAHGASALLSADSLAQSYTEQAAGKLFGMPTQSEDRSLDKPTAETSPRAVDQSQATNRFHYASPPTGQQADQAPNSFSYSYFSSRPQPLPIQYPYSTLSTLPQYQPRPLFGLSSQPQHLSFDSQSSLAHQAHQPHSHEHFMAQYMLNQPPAPSMDSSSPLREPSALINESPLLRLRVKTSKSLDLSQGTKSAQMRLQPSSGHSSAPIHNSPAQALRSQRHHQQQQQQPYRRSGKQSHQLKTAPTNRSPVVYHVLRSPTGRVFNQYNQQGYAIAYDQ